MINPSLQKTKKYMRLIVFFTFWLMATLCHASPSERQVTLLTVNCLQCHANEDTGAPVMGQSEVWQPILAQGQRQIMTHVVEGLRGMPPLGYCSACNEADLIVLTELLAGQTLPKAPL